MQGGEDVPAVLLLGGEGELNLDAVYAVDTVDEEDEDEDESDLHPILDFGYYWAFGDEAARRDHVNIRLMIRKGKSTRGERHT